MKNIITNNQETDINKGVWLYQPEPIDELATIAVTGLGRSGTTMISRILSELGLYMGKSISPNTHEDKEFQILIKERNYDAFNQLCRVRDNQYFKWGFKCPALREELTTFCSYMRSPRVIVVFRDVLAISIRNNLHLQTDVLNSLSKVARGYSQLIEQITFCKMPVLAISYEKALQFPDNTINEIANFCGLTVKNNALTQLSKMIENGDKKYFPSTKI